MFELERGVSASLARTTDRHLGWPDLPEDPVEELLDTIIRWFLNEGGLYGVTAQAAVMTGTAVPVIATEAQEQWHDAYAELYALAVLRVAGIEPTSTGCCGYLIRCYLGRIVTGAVHPAVGAHALWFWGARPAMAESEAYQLLQPLAASWDLDEPARERTEVAIRAVAARLLAANSTGPGNDPRLKDPSANGPVELG